MLKYLLFCALLIPGRANAEPRDHIKDLTKLCKVWSTVKFLDPQLMSHEVDWDGALVRAVPHVREAQTDEQFADAIGAMLAELHDPATREVQVDTTADPSKVELLRWEGDVLVANVGPYGNGEESLYAVRDSLASQIGKAKRVVIDLRSRWSLEWFLSYLPLVNARLSVPGFRYVFHSGYAPQVGSTSGGYYSGLLLTASPPLEPQPLAQPGSSRLVFVVGKDVPMPVAALWWAGKAAIVSETPLSDASLALTTEIEITDRSVARIRVGEPTEGGVSADAVDANPMKKALAIARGSKPFATHAPREIPATPVLQKDAAYADMTYPDLPYRLLALFRAWSIIDRFYPYKHLIGDWDAVLGEFIPRFEAAKDAREYAEAVLEMAAHVEDGHTMVSGHPEVNNILGTGPAFLPFEIRSVEGKYVITNKTAGVGEDTPVALGDEVLSIDGEPLSDRVKRLWKYLPASTEAARTNRILRAFRRGPKDSVAELVVRGPDRASRTVKVARMNQWREFISSRQTWEVLSGNIGYADLTRLMPEQVDSMFDALKDTKAIIFDMRGYPHSTAWSIAPRINTNNAKIGATFRRAEISAFSTQETGSGFHFDQALPVTEKPKYTRPTVMLIDDRAISQSEHSGLFYEAANGTKFMGSNSAGANGDVTNFLLPGGVQVSFTGHDVRHADGRQLQRVGLVPDVRVTPTIRGIRKGKDEVLERAIKFLGGK